MAVELLGGGERRCSQRREGPPKWAMSAGRLHGSELGLADALGLGLGLVVLGALELALLDACVHGRSKLADRGDERLFGRERDELGEGLRRLRGRDDALVGQINQDAGGELLRGHGWTPREKRGI